MQATGRLGHFDPKIIASAGKLQVSTGVNENTAAGGQYGLSIHNTSIIEAADQYELIFWGLTSEAYAKSGTGV